jgi:serine/threonine-protein kinase
MACPKGHAVDGQGGGKVDDDGEASTIGVDLSNADAETAPVASPSRPSTLFECEPCGRLVETQDHRGQVVIPCFCPWCGHAVEPIIGREIDGYEVGDLLAQGGFGLVYLASNVAEPKMKAVIKFLRPRMGYLQPALIRVFVEEARLTEEIGQTCWNVVRVSNVRERPWPYFFMEYIRGTTLDQVLRTAKDKKIPIEDAKGYLRGIAKALAATHAHGRVHRDLKPLNIMVIQSQEIRAEERIKLVDFGLSMKIARGRTSFEGATSALDDGTAPGQSPVQSAGTPEYMPPEAFDGLNEFAGDIYSFGVTAYEILTGETPWTQPPDGSQRFFYWRDTHKKAPPRPIREVRPEVPGWLAGVVMKCLAKDPKDRIRTADELISSLREPMPRWLWAAAGAAALVFGVLLWFALRGGVDQKVPSWNGPGESVRNEHRVWVKDPVELAGIEVTLAERDGSKILDCLPSSPPGFCKVEEGHIRVRFRNWPDPESLIGSRIAIEGHGSGFRVAGTLVVGQDRKPPSLGTLRMIEAWHSTPTVKPLPDVKRFHSKKVALAVSVEDEEGSLRDLRLRLNNRWDVGVPVKAVEGVEENIEGEDLWTFSLAEVSTGAYQAWVEASDWADNKATTEQVQMWVDDKAELTVINPVYIAARRAWYEVQGVEALATLEVRGRECTIHEREMGTALQVAKKAATLPVVKPQGLEEDLRYLLAVVVDGNTEGPFDLVLTDTATPPNTSIVSSELPFKAPEPLDAKTDIIRIALEFEDQDGEPVPLEAFPSEGFKFPSARFTRVRQLRADFKKDRVHGMTLALQGKEVDGEVVDDSPAVVHGFDLEGSADRASTENRLRLTLRDPLDRPLEVKLSVLTDLRPPEIVLHSRSNGKEDPTDHRVDSWDKVELWIEANEQLSRVECRKLGARITETLETGGKTARLSTSGLEYTEGRHAFVVHAWDLAGNHASKEDVVVLNEGPPRIRPLVKDASGPLELTDPFSFEVTDGNKPLTYKGAEVTFNVAGKQIPVTITPPRSAGSDSHSVSLARVPDGAGTLTIRIADHFGLQSEDTRDFTFRRPQERWKPTVPDWRGLDWVLVAGRNGKEYYISRTEVPNKVYMALYRKAGARRPKFWGEGDKLPTYTREDGGSVDLSLYPVVGVAPEDAGKVARALGGRLPLLVEWRDAAWRTNPGGEYPWKQGEAGKDYANCYGVCDRPGSPFQDRRYHAHIIKWHGGIAPFRAVEVSFFDPWPEDVKQRLGYAGEILHLIGNVGELVVMEDGSHRIAGGDFTSSYETLKLREEGVSKEYQAPPDSLTGFRVVILLDTAPEEFKKLARDAGRK